MDRTQTMRATTPYHTQGIADKNTARTHYLGGRELVEYSKSHFEGTTNYSDNYHAHALPGKLAVPPPVPRPQKPFDATTSYANQFKGQPANTGHFDGSTTYGNAFVGHALEARAAAPAPQARPQGKFEGRSAYQDSFVPHSIEPRSPMAPAQAPRSNGAFDGTTTYGANYHPHQLPEKPHYSAPEPRAQVPFDGTTTNQDSYRAHDVQPRQVHGPAAVARPHVPFDAHTTNQDTYRDHGVQPRAAAPPPPAMRPHLPFDGTTTSRDAFQGWQLPPQFPSIGLEILGDRMHTLVPRGAALPFSASHVFSTVHDAQRELCILIYSGNSAVASENELLGQFDLTGLPSGRARSPQIEVTFAVDADRVLSVVARDLDSQRQYEWLQNGRMLARTLSGALGEVRGGGGAQMTVYPHAGAGLHA